MVWHVVLAVGGALLLYRVAEPLRAGDLFYVDLFIWGVLAAAALAAGGVGGLIEGWLTRRRHTVLAACVAGGAAFAMFSVAVFFVGRFANSMRVAVTPDTYLVPLSGWLLFIVLLTVVAMRRPVAPSGTAAASMSPSRPG